MKVLFLSRFSLPHIGGVEKHIDKLSKVLEKRGYRVRVVDSSIIKYPKIKFFGLLYIWYWLFKNREIIEKSDIVHIHDVFIWYLPFRFLFPFKKVYMTFHGGQDVWPVPFKNKLYGKIASVLSKGSIAIGGFIPKYYGIKPTVVSYGAVSQTLSKNTHKKEKMIIFLGRLERQTGVLEFIKRIKNKKGYKIHFLGDGSLREKCAKFGEVHGFVNPNPFLKKAKICFAGGYLAALEALNSGCELWVGWDTPIKNDYWKLSPFLKKDSRDWAVHQTWKMLADQYIHLWGSNL